MKKQNYEAPVMEQMEVSVEKNFVATGEGMNKSTGSWDLDPNA